MKLNGPWNLGDVENFLAKAIVPARIAVVTGNGAPLVLSLWFLYHERALWCASNKRARVIDWLTRNPDCGFEIAPDAPPYKGVRGQGVATLHPEEGARILTDLMPRYQIRENSRLGTMLQKSMPDEIAIRITPRWLTSWDFSDRMADKHE